MQKKGNNRVADCLRRKMSVLLLLVVTTGLVLAGCSSGKEEGQTVSSENQMRKIVDLTGREVEVPKAEAIQRVVIIAPPLVATFASVVKDTDKLVGVHPTAVTIANKNLLDLVVPNWQNINTAFISGFTSNTEEVLKMKPDIILVYGDSQKEGLENLQIPIVDFYLENPENEAWSVEIDRLMRELFEVNTEGTLQNEWDRANQIVEEALSGIEASQRKTALMIRSNTQDSISVRGANYYGDDWLVKTGLKNLAGDMQGDNVQISMEQLYQWNPDIVYDFVGQDADRYLSNEITGEDWSQVAAYKTGAIYDMPQGMFNWGAPNVDSPLTLIWMTMKNYPDRIDDSFFRTYMRDYYQRMYEIELSDSLIDEILNPQK